MQALYVIITNYYYYYYTDNAQINFELQRPVYALSQ